MKRGIKWLVKHNSSFVILSLSIVIVHVALTKKNCIYRFLFIDFGDLSKMHQTIRKIQLDVDWVLSDKRRICLDVSLKN